MAVDELPGGHTGKPLANRPGWDTLFSVNVQRRREGLPVGGTVIQVHGVGPFEMQYVNPADDPRKQDSRK